jgi:hypothetical protein
MGVVLMVMISLLAGLLFLAGWASFDSICLCTPLTSHVAKGILGLSATAGALVGVFLSIIWN